MADRICPHCSTRKSADAFYRNRSRADGLSTYCKACTRAVRATRYRDTIRAQQAAWNAANPGKATEYTRRWARSNRDALRAKAARKRERDIQRVRWTVRIADANKRARRAGVPGILTDAAVRARWAYFGGKCWMCGGIATENDHVKPIRAGGANWPSNIRPACHPCNDAKRNRWPYPPEVVRGSSTADRQGIGGRAA